MLSHQCRHIHILIYHQDNQVSNSHHHHKPDHNCNQHRFFSCHRSDNQVSNSHHHHNCNQHSCFPCHRSDLQLMNYCILEIGQILNESVSCPYIKSFFKYLWKFKDVVNKQKQTSIIYFPGFLC